MGQFDASIKHAIVAHPADWARFLGAPANATVEVVDSDISTVSYAVDKVLKVGDAQPFVLHVEPQGYYDPDLDVRMYSYNGLLWRRHGVFVHSTVLVLHRGAWGSKNLGGVRGESPIGGCRTDFTYRPIHVWDLPVESILRAGVGVLPLAPIANVEADALPPVIERMERRFEEEVPRSDAAELWTATLLLLGLRYERRFARDLLKGVHHIMHESSTYQAIIEEGEKRGEKKGEVRGQVQARRETLLLQGAKQFGARARRFVLKSTKSPA